MTDTITHDRTTSNGEALHEFFGADPDSYNIDLDETADGSGRPGIGMAGRAIQFWVGQAKGPVTVGAAAAIFGMPPEAVAQAVAEHPWMLLGGPAAGPIEDRRIELDGE